MSLSAVLFSNRRLTASLVAGVAVAALAACGSQSTSSGGSTTPANGSSRGPGGGRGAMSAYFQCLQQNGVTMTRPSGGAAPSGGVAPSGATGGGNGGPGGNGTPPSGGPGGGGNGGPRGGMTITKPDGVSDDVWTKAQAACSTLAPSAAATASATS